jgi:1-acyl-sn-glycerol-3-phosphate acyltransferase
MTERYDHATYESRRRILRWLIHNFGYRVFAKFDGAEHTERLPTEGPAIVIYNHIAFIDPIVVLSCLPRNVVPLARHDVFRIPAWGIFPRLWDVIPVRRGEVDRAALRRALSVLEAGEVLLVAPEGTRAPQLQRAKVGLAYLATKSGAPIVPAAVTGTDGYPTLRIGRKREVGAIVRLGEPFRFISGDGLPDRAALRQMTDEAMYVLAAMLPEDRRGVYADLRNASTDTIKFLGPRP